MIGTYYVIGYVGLGGPVIGVGLLALAHGLSDATVIVAGVIGVLCLTLSPLVATETRRRTRVAV